MCSKDGKYNPLFVFGLFFGSKTHLDLFDDFKIKLNLHLQVAVQDCCSAWEYFIPIYFTGNINESTLHIMAGVCVLGMGGGQSVLPSTSCLPTCRLSS